MKFTEGFSKKVVALLCAGAMTCAAVPAMAFADTGGGTGATSVTIVTDADSTTEYGGTDDPNNPDRGDGYGSKLAYDVPTEIAFTADSQGALTIAASASYAIENKGMAPIHVSSMSIDKPSDVNLRTTAQIAADGNPTNSVQFKVGPTGDQMEAATVYNETNHKKDVTTAANWNMGNAESETKSLAITGSGQIKNVTKDISTAQQVATVHWYCTSGIAE